jgi:hypothetical protein
MSPIIDELTCSWPKIEGYVLAMPEDEVEAAWRATAVYQTIRHALNYQVMGSTISPFRPLSPTESLLPDRGVLVSAVASRLSGWSEADIDRYVNELLAESEMLKKWNLRGDEARLIESLQSLARKDLDTLKMTDQVRIDRALLPRINRMEDVEMTD